MAESLRDVIAKLKQQQAQSSQTSKPSSAPAPIPEKEDIPAFVKEKDEDDIEEIQETPKKELSMQERIAMEIEMLQNDGRFRAELLNQLQELNKALVVIADILIDKKR